MSSYSLFTARNVVNAILVGMAIASLTFVGLLTVSRSIEVRTEYLIIQETQSQDFYTMSKSVEYAGNVLREAVLSNLFFSEASKVGSFDEGDFGGDMRDRLKEWQRTVGVTSRSSAGILVVTVEHNNANQAMGIAQAISETLVQNNQMFRSGTEDTIRLQVITGPIMEQNPSLEEIVMALVAGFMGGFLLVFSLLLWRDASWQEGQELPVESYKPIPMQDFSVVSYGGSSDKFQNENNSSVADQSFDTMVGRGEEVSQSSAENIDHTKDDGIRDLRKKPKEEAQDNSEQKQEDAELHAWRERELEKERRLAQVVAMPARESL